MTSNDFPDSKKDKSAEPEPARSAKSESIKPTKPVKPTPDCIYHRYDIRVERPAGYTTQVKTVRYCTRCGKIANTTIR